MIDRWIVLTTLLMCIGAWAGGEGVPTEWDVPELPSAQLSMSWADLRALVDSLRPPGESHQKDSSPPVSWTVREARYQGEVVSPNRVCIHARMVIMVWETDGWVRVPVLRTSAAPTLVTLDGAPASLAKGEDDAFSVLIDEPGMHTFETEFFAHCATDEGRVTLEFDCVPTPLTQLTLRLPETDAQVTSPLAGNIEVTTDDGRLCAALAFPSTERIDVAWTLPAKARGTNPVEPPQITSTVTTLVSVTDRFLACTSRLHYQVLRGETDAFTFRLPQGVTVLAVEGEGAAWSSTEDAESVRVDLTVNHVVKDRYEVTLDYEAPLGSDAGIATVPELTVENVARRTGYIGVTALGNIRVDVPEDLSGLTRVDTADLPASLGAMATNPVLLAFKFTDTAYALALSVERLSEVRVRVASIDYARLTTVLLKDGSTITRAVYTVRNNVKQFLNVDIGDDATVWGAEVGGRVVRPAREGNSSAVLVPLFKSAEVNRRLGGFPVELVYMTPSPQTKRLPRKVGLHAPSTDILANVVEWEVYVPEDRLVFRSSGDLDPLPGAPSDARTPASQRSTKGTRREMLQRLKDDVERFMVTNVDQPAAAATPRASTQDRASDALTIAGVLPVQIQIPTEGVTHAFKRIVVPQGQRLELTLFTCPAWMGTGFRVVSFILCVSVGIWFGCWTWRQYHTKKVPIVKLTLPVGLVAAGLAVACALHAATGPLCVSVACAYLLSLTFSCVWAQRVSPCAQDAGPVTGTGD